MTLKRQKHWSTRTYHDFLMESARIPFAWGKHDCALFAADGIRTITGVDIAANFRGKYSDEAGAMAAIKEIAGGSTVADAAAWCAQKYSLMEWPKPLFAQRGDLVIFQAPTGNLVSGLVHLSGQLVAVGEKGLYLFPVSRILRAWHYE
jgi:hypothetical protein